jgi:hypothetical protein
VNLFEGQILTDDRVVRVRLHYTGHTVAASFLPTAAVTLRSGDTIVRELGGDIILDLERYGGSMLLMPWSEVTLTFQTAELREHTLGWWP